MPKKSTKIILAAVKKAGADLGDDLDKVTEALDDVELSAEEFLSTDQIILTKDEHRELKDDLTKLRTRMKDAETRSKDLQEAMDTGDSDNVRKATQYKKKLDELDPLVKSLMAAQNKSWTAATDRIPKKLREEFTFAEKDGDGKVTKELTTEELIANTAKFHDFVRLGLIEAADGDGGEGGAGSEGGDGEKKPEGTPRVAQKQQRKLTKEQLDEMPAAVKMEAGYKPRTPEGTAT